MKRLFTLIGFAAVCCWAAASITIQIRGTKVQMGGRVFILQNGNIYDINGRQISIK